MKRMVLAFALLAGTTAYANDLVVFDTKPSPERSAVIAQAFGSDIAAGAYTAEDIATFALDLNGDKTNEIFTYANTSFWCGSSGCDIGVFEKSGGSWKRIMDVNAGETIGVGDKSTSGYRDIYLKSATTGQPVRWTFDGKSYVLND